MLKNRLLSHHNLWWHQGQNVPKQHCHLCLLNMGHWCLLVYYAATWLSKGLFYCETFFLLLKIIWSILIFFVKFWSIADFLVFLRYFCNLYEEVQHRSVRGAKPCHRSGGYKRRSCHWTSKADVSKMRDCAGWFWLQNDRNERERWKIFVSACSFQKKSLSLHRLWYSSLAQLTLWGN